MIYVSNLHPLKNDVTALHVSLGHNSSAVLTKGGKIVRGYEQERLDGRKSSSAYPIDAINQAINSFEKPSYVFVGHWFDHFDLDKISKYNKYLNIEHLKSFDSAKIISLSPQFTHHDSHANSAMNFMRSNVRPDDDTETTVVVLDGFGNRQECFSVYRDRQLVHRTYGYEMSLGLMYQYTTEYLGLKPHQDEYKLLGYEAHILSCATKEEAYDVRNFIRGQAKIHADSMLSARSMPRATHELIDFERLKTARAMWWENADRWSKMWRNVKSEQGKKICVAFCAQTFIEECVDFLLDELAPNAKRLALAGGCFYNVKLNRSIAMRSNKPEVFVNPLSGDQGAALGFSADIRWTDLKWGTRYMERPDSSSLNFSGILLCERHKWANVAGELLSRNKIVNVFRPRMEYGPRALCSTSTLALPNARNVRIINALNNRDESMPMAPVMSLSSAAAFLSADEIQRQYASLKYMITTCSFSSPPPDALMGVSHRDPVENLYTARPQIISSIDDPEMFNVLTSSPNSVLINTSFNFHGEPIVWSMQNAIDTHKKQMLQAMVNNLDEPTTLLVMP